MIPAAVLKFAAGIVGPRFAAAAVYAVLAIVLVGGFVGLKSCYDSGVVDRARSKSNEKVIKTTGAANSNAAEARAGDQVRTASEQAQVEKAISDAKHEGRDPRAAYYDCVRLQQQARAAGDPTPTCS